MEDTNKGILKTDDSIFSLPYSDLVKYIDKLHSLNNKQLVIKSVADYLNMEVEEDLVDFNGAATEALFLDIMADSDSYPFKTTYKSATDMYRKDEDKCLLAYVLVQNKMFRNLAEWYKNKDKKD